MDNFGIIIMVLGGLVLLALLVISMLKKPMPKKDSRSKRQKNLDKIANIKGNK